MDKGKPPTQNVKWQNNLKIKKLFIPFKQNSTPSVSTYMQTTASILLNSNFYKQNAQHPQFTPLPYGHLANLSSASVHQQALPTNINNYNNHLSSQNSHQVPSSSFNNHMNGARNMSVRFSPYMSARVQPSSRTGNNVDRVDCTQPYRILQQDRVYMCSFCPAVR